MLVTPVVREVDGRRRQCGFRNEYPDTRKTDAGKSAVPSVSELFAVGAGGESEDQLVVFSVGEGTADVGSAAERQGGGLEGGRGAARREGAEIFREAVAEIHHGADRRVSGEPRALGEPGLKRDVMPGRQTGAEFAGDVNLIADARAGARDDAGASGRAEESETGGDDAIGLRDVAADDGYAVVTSASGEAAVELLEPSEARAGVEGECEDGGGGVSAHGSEIAEVALEEFCADVAWGDGVVEMARVDHGVDRNELAETRGGEHGAIVTDPKGCAW